MHSGALRAGGRRADAAAAAQGRGWRVYVAPVERRDWLNVGRSLFTRDFWASSCTCDPGYRRAPARPGRARRSAGQACDAPPGGRGRWYLGRVKAAVDAARRECGAEQARARRGPCRGACAYAAVAEARARQRQVDLVGHSAGGWLGRAFLGDPLGFDSPAAAPGVPHASVRALVTLGTPQRPPPAALARDMTGGLPLRSPVLCEAGRGLSTPMAVGAGGALRWVDTQWPGAPASRRRAQARARAAAHGLCSRRRLLRRPGRALRVRGGPRGQGRQVGAAAHAAARGVHQLLPGARGAGV